jgi:hypothetical protein
VGLPSPGVGRGGEVELGGAVVPAVADQCRGIHGPAAVQDLSDLVVEGTKCAKVVSLDDDLVKHETSLVPRIKPARLR